MVAGSPSHIVNERSGDYTTIYYILLYAMMVPYSIVILATVFVLIAVRQIGNVRLPIWLIMTGGAMAVLVTGQISPASALRSINYDVILFLFGMFVIGQALEDSGYLSYVSYHFFGMAKTIDHLILFILFGMGMASAFLMNDTVAIVGTPIVILLARQHRFPSKIVLLALAFAVTIGSVITPIGNPQDLLIAMHGHIKNPFVSFFEFLFLPTMLNLYIAFLLLKLFYKDEFHDSPLRHFQVPIKDHHLATLSKISFCVMVSLICLKIAGTLLNVYTDFRLTYIALISALPLLIFSPKRFYLLRKLDVQTLVFFGAMFVLMQSVWDSGFFQRFITRVTIDSIPAIMLVSVLLSQLISNVPLVALYLSLFQNIGVSTKAMLSLAAGSTIAGNMLILGAASNVIIIHNAEKNGETLSFFEFARIGIPLTIVNVFIYWMYLALI